MKKKFITLLLAGSMLLSANAFAAQETAYTSGNTLLILSGYDKDNKLIGIRTYNSADDNSSITADDTVIENAKKYVLVKLDKSTNTFEIIPDVTPDIIVPKPTSEPTAEPTVAPSAEPTTEPTTAPSAEPTAPAYPSAYPTQKDAVNALALVTKVYKSLDENEETITKIDCYYQGRERTLFIEDDVKLTSGDDVTTLKEGDMIHFVVSLSGKIKTVSLDFRPSSKDIMSQNPNISSFQTLLGNANGADYPSALNDKSGYYLGIITDKRNSSFTLYDIDGLAKHSADLSYSKDTIVYTCDLTKKTDISLSNSSGIQKSSIVKSSYDDDDNITWNSDSTYVYAVANVIDDEVAEMIVYTYDN